MNEITLDKEEQEILQSSDRGEWKSVPNVKKEIEKHRNYARQTLKKNKRVNIRISHKVLRSFKLLRLKRVSLIKRLCPAFYIVMLRDVLLIDIGRTNHLSLAGE